MDYTLVCAEQLRAACAVAVCSYNGSEIREPCLHAVVAVVAVHEAHNVVKCNTWYQFHPTHLPQKNHPAAADLQRLCMPPPITTSAGLVNHRPR